MQAKTSLDTSETQITENDINGTMPLDADAGDVPSSDEPQPLSAVFAKRDRSRENLHIQQV